MAKRVMARVSDEMGVKIATWADKLGITQSQLMGMAIQAGLDSIIRAVDPVNSLSVDKLAEIVEAMERRKGVEGDAKTG